MSSRHDLQRQAALWIRRLDREDSLQDVQAGFIHWCRQSPRHVRAVLELSRLREELQRLDAASQTTDAAALVERLLRNAQQSAASDALPTRSWWRAPAPKLFKTLRSALPDTERVSRLLMATAVAISLLMLALLTRSTLDARPPQYVTQAGESRRVILNDNTHVRLGPNTWLVTRFDRHQRLIELHGGEAMFHVSPDPSRPFLVRTDMLTARAIGTAFAVSRYQDEQSQTASVTVASGQVDVHAAGAATLRLEGSEQALLQAGREIQVHRVDTRDALAWVDNRLVFYQGATLATAARQFNRRNRLQIVITDPVLAARPVMGTFRASDPQAFLNHFAPLVPFRMRVDPPDRVRLMPL